MATCGSDFRERQDRIDRVPTGRARLVIGLKLNGIEQNRPGATTDRRRRPPLSGGIDHRDEWEPVKIGVARINLLDAMLAH
jgi:hypothetical protein